MRSHSAGDTTFAFVEHSKRVLSRDHLLELSRNRSVEPLDRSIDAQVSRLRRKLDTVADADSGLSYLRTPLTWLRLSAEFIADQGLRGTSRETGGTGRGLTIARTAIRTNDGEITLRNGDEGGLSIVVSLPKLPPPC